MEPFVIGNTTVLPGERKTIKIPLAKLYDSTVMELNMHVYHGVQEGPVLFISAAVHGDEIQGIEIIRRIQTRKGLSKLRGTLILIPVVNVFGFNSKSRYLPDGRDLNRAFPGNAKGSLASQIADIITTEVIKKADYGIDLHTGAKDRSNVPQIRACLDDPITKKLAKVFGVPIVINASVRDGSMRETANSLGVPMLLYEAGEALRFDEGSIKKGVTGILNVMFFLKMLDSTKPLKKIENVYMAQSSMWIRAVCSGLIRSHIKQGSMVKKGQVLAVISNPYITSSTTELLAATTGLVIGKMQNPLVNKGDAVFHIASFEALKELEEAIEEYDYGFDAITPKKFVD